MTRNDVLERFDNLNVWKRGDQRAPHKPLLILYALGLYSQGHGRLIPYEEIDEEVKQLLIEFGPPRKSHHPEYPFWRLQNDGIWTVAESDTFERRKGKSDAKKSELIKHDAKGGFVESLFELVDDDPELAQTIVERILEEFFAASIREDLLDAVGLQAEMRPALSDSRDPNFRRQILRAYEYRCAVCGFDLKLGPKNIALEAAHVKWHQYDGPDVVQNGVALCVLHHKLFDRGAIHITPEYRLLVSEDVHGTRSFVDELREFHEREIHRPQKAKYYVREAFAEWHRGEVFWEVG